MKLKNLPFVVGLTLATAFIVGCGDEKDPRLSDADVMYIKQQRLQQQYGTAGGTTTVVSTVTVTTNKTVTATANDN